MFTNNKFRIARLGIIAILCICLIQSFCGSVGNAEQVVSNDSNTWLSSSDYYAKPSGTGKIDSPYLIGSEKHLAYLTYAPSTFTNSYIKLTANLDCRRISGFL